MDQVAAIQSLDPAGATPVRRACHGSCHCKHITYIVFLTLPHLGPSSAQEVYRCNCTTCYKMNMFHVHPANPRTDFLLLSPLDPDSDLSVYQCNDKKRQFYFCPKCGVRCFTFSGPAELAAVDANELGGVNANQGKRQVWRAKWDGGEDTRPYLSVNGTTIDFRGDFDLRMLTEQKMVKYFDGRSEPEREEPGRWERPHYGGCY